MKHWQETLSVRKSARARYIRINITRQGEVILVIPKRVSKDSAMLFLQTKLDWIEMHLAKLVVNPANEPTLPTTLELKYLNKNWAILYDDRQKKCLEMSDQLLLPHCQDLQELSQHLDPWLKQKAWLNFPDHLAQLSKQCELPFANLNIRIQKTRWGSCSFAKKINLNARLLFLPHEVADYVMIHELCHTRHLNHGQKFWQLVAKFCPDYESLEKQLKNANGHLPDFAKI